MIFLLYYRVYSQYEAKDRRHRAALLDQVWILDYFTVSRVTRNPRLTVPNAAHMRYNLNKTLNACRVNCISVVRISQFGAVYVLLNLNKRMNFVSWCKLMNTRRTVFWKLQANTLQPVTLKRLDWFSFFGRPTENSVSFFQNKRPNLTLVAGIDRDKTDCGMIPAPLVNT